MAGLVVPAIHVFDVALLQNVDARDPLRRSASEASKRRHDGA
jgi:hypothetical protein